MAQDRQQIEDEVASLRRARNDLENKLDAAMETGRRGYKRAS